VCVLQIRGNVARLLFAVSHVAGSPVLRIKNQLDRRAGNAATTFLDTNGVMKRAKYVCIFPDFLRDVNYHKDHTTHTKKQSTMKRGGV